MPSGLKSSSVPKSSSEPEVVVGEAEAIAKLRGDPEDVAVAGERLAGLHLELLHGVHELHLVLGVLLFEGGRVDPAPPFLTLPTFGFRGGGGLDEEAYGRLGGPTISPFEPGSPVVEERIGRKGIEIEFRGVLRRLNGVGHLESPRDGNASPGDRPSARSRGVGSRWRGPGLDDRPPRVNPGRGPIGRLPNS